MSDIHIYVGDSGINFDLSIWDTDGVVNLEGVSSIKAKCVRSDQSSFEKDVTVVNSDSGLCKMTFDDSDLTVPGTYRFQVIASFGENDQFSSSPRTFVVRSRL